MRLPEFEPVSDKAPEAYHHSDPRRRWISSIKLWSLMQAMMSEPMPALPDVIRAAVWV
jgi:hypothetical protein